MKVNSESLLSAWKLASRAVAANPPNPATGCCRVVAVDGAGSVIGTNLELWCIGKFPCEGDINVLLDAKRFGLWLSTIPGDDITLTLDDKGNVHATSQRSDVTMPTVEISKFPALDAVSGSAASTAADISAAFSRLMFGSDDDATNNGMAIGGMSIEAVEMDKIHLSSSDGKVISTMSIPAISNADAACKVPEQFVRAVVSFARQDGITLQISENLISLSWEGGEIRSRLLHGDPKKVRKVAGFHQCDEPFITAPCGYLKTAVDRARATVTEDSNGIELALSSGTLTVSSGTEAGKSSSEIPISYEGPAISRILAHRYLSGLCRCCKPDSTLEFRFFPGNEKLVVEFRTADGAVSFIAGIDPEPFVP